MVATMLYVLETMQWFLKTAFGQSETLFGGMRWDPSIGLGQRNGAAPPDFLAVAVSTSMINILHARAWDGICGNMIERCIYFGSSPVH
jgi:hypothetical protein